MNKRIGYIDIAKGITILLVIIGHVEAISPPVKSIIYSFHMPIFFLLSGYFFRDDTLLNAINKMVHSLVIPYFVVGAIMRICQIGINVTEGNPIDYIDICSLFGVTWKFGKETDLVSVGAIWFLVVLFWSKLYLQVVLKSKFSLLILILLANLSIFGTWAFGIILPFGIHQALVCALFVYAGSLCKKYELFEKKVPTISFFLFLLSVIPFTLFFSVATRANEYQYGIMSIIISSFISMIVVYAVKKIFDERSKIIGKLSDLLAWCGRYSIIILAVHSIEARYICVYLPCTNWITEIITRILYTLIITLICTKIGIVRSVFNLNTK